MSQTAKSFTKVMEDEVLPFLKKHPEWTRLQDPNKTVHPTPFAIFRYAFRDWQIRSDTLVDKLLAAYALEKEGEKPFVSSKTKTKNGTLCLRLNIEGRDEADGLYIYEK